MLLQLLHEEDAQDSFEYMLAVSVGAIAIVGAFFLGFQNVAPQILKHLCPSVDPLDPASVSCLSP